MIRIFSLLAAGLLGWCLYPTLSEIARICWGDEDYSHGLILPLVSGYILWLERGRIFERWNRIGRGRFSLLGFLLFAAGLAGLAAGAVTQILYLSWVGVFPAVLGFLLLVLGFEAAVPLFAPVLLLFMAKPIPDSLVPILFFPLQVFAAKVSAAVLGLLNVPVYLVGNIIEIPGMRLMVEEACSGIRSLMALLTVACIVMLIVPMSRMSQVVIFGISILTAVALNVVRVALTGILAHFYDPKAASGFFHEFSGLVVFGVGLAIVYSLANLFAKKGEQDVGVSHPIALPTVVPAGAYASFAVLALSLGIQQLSSHQLLQRSEIHLELSQFPRTFDGWIGRDGEKMELNSRETLKLDQYVRRFYSKEGEKTGFLYIGYWGKQSGEYQAAKHSPMMCLPANGFKVTKLSPLFVPLSDGRQVEVSRVLSQFDQHYSLVYYYFFNGPQFYVREWEALIRIAMNGLLGERTDGGIVEVSVELTAEEARKLQQSDAHPGGQDLVRASLEKLDGLIRASSR